MGFTIEQVQTDDFLILRLQDLSSGTIIEVLPEHGALLHRFVVETAEGTHNLIDNYPTLAHLNEEIHLSYKSCKASPFVCRIPEGKYDWGGVSYEFNKKFVDGSAIHGLISNKPFKITDAVANEHEAFVSLKYHYKKEDVGFPFEYICEVGYRLKGNQLLEISTRTTNLDAIDIPLADGWHPYFTLGGKVDDCHLQFASDSMLEFDEKLIPTGKFIHVPEFVNGRLLGDYFLDNCFQLKVSVTAAVCSLYHPTNHRKLTVFVDQGYPFLQLYTPPHRNSIAIENLSGAPDCYNNGMGLTILEPGKTFTATTWFKFEQLS